MIGNLAAAGRSKMAAERSRAIRLRTPRPARGKDNGTAGPGRWPLAPAQAPARGLRCKPMTRFWGPVMNIAYYHASKFGNGAMVAEEFKKIMAARGVTVSVQHIRDANPKDLPEADLYVFSSPGRMGKPKGNVRRFLGKVSPGARDQVRDPDHPGRPEAGQEDRQDADPGRAGPVGAGHPDHE